MAHSTDPAPPTPLGESPAFQAMLAHVSRLAPLDRPVLVVGARGTGKELVASRLAYLSPRWDRPFVKLNCAALPESLLDSELFGHEAGAFTGAGRRRPGRFELADGGTLFLDEIANASLSVQEKLLRAIEYGAFERVGGNDTVVVDVRVIAATNADLPALAAAGRFRADLLDRLAFDVVALPALRDRPEDIPLLAEHFATRMTAELGRPYFAGFTPAAMDALCAHDWPGNVRELRNAVERSVCRAERPERPLAEMVIDPFATTVLDTGPPFLSGEGQSHLAFAPSRPGLARALTSFPGAIKDVGGRAKPGHDDEWRRYEGPALEEGATDPSASSDFRAAVRRFEAGLLGRALVAARFNQRRAAERLGLSYDQFRRLLKSHPTLTGAS